MRRCVIHSHATTWHDGAVALLLPEGELVALAAERVGDRYKHSWNSKLAYDYLAARPEYMSYFATADDHFYDSTDGLDTGDHHLYHAANAFLTSGFPDAAILVVDGQGPREGHVASTTLWAGEGQSISFVEEYFPADPPFAPHSIGHFYTAIGVLAGMTSLYDEGKTMALAAFGRPSAFLDWLRERARSEPDGTYFLDPHFSLAILGNTLGQKYYGWPRQPPIIQSLWNEALHATRAPPFTERTDFQQGHMDVALAGQTILEEIVVGLAHRAYAMTGSTRLCLAGGVALNCVANEAIAAKGPFSEMYVGPTPSDEGQALGKLLLHASKAGNLPTRSTSPYLGPSYSRAEIRSVLHGALDSIIYEYLEEQELIEATISVVVDGGVVALCYDRSEIGPRALGHRSIIADPRDPDMREHINADVKGREWFRPLAPMVIEAHAADFFDLDRPSPYMTHAVKIKAEQLATIPAVTHVDGTARVQTITNEQDPRCHGLLTEFARRTGIPVLLNTSFNRRNEPIVESPADALKAFCAMKLDTLVLGNYLVRKRSLPKRAGKTSAVPPSLHPTEPDPK